MTVGSRYNLRSQLHWVVGNHSEARSFPAVNLPIEYRNYIADGGAMEAFLSEQPLYMVLWPIDDIDQFNVEYEVPKYAPGFLCFGTNGGGELLAFDTAGAIFYLPAIGMEPKYAILIASSWPEFTRIIVPAE